MVILSANNDTLILSRDTRWDTDEGDYAQAEPIVSFNLKTSQSLVIYSSNRVVEHTRSFPHAWISDNQLVVMDGTDLVCLMTNQGIMWDSYEEKSLGSMVTITEDWQNEHRFAATELNASNILTLPKLNQRFLISTSINSGNCWGIIR